MELRKVDVGLGVGGMEYGTSYLYFRDFEAEQERYSRLKHGTPFPAFCSSTLIGYSEHSQLDHCLLFCSPVKAG